RLGRGRDPEHHRRLPDRRLTVASIRFERARVLPCTCAHPSQRRVLAPMLLRGVSTALLFAGELVEKVLEDLLGPAPLVSRQAKAHAPVRALDHPAVPHFTRFFAQGVRRLPKRPGFRHAVCSITTTTAIRRSTAVANVRVS